MDTLKYTISDDRPIVFETITIKDGDNYIPYGYKLNYNVTQLEDGKWQYYTLPLSKTMYDYIKGDTNKVYECIISKIVRQRYPDNDMIAILSNYLCEPENEKYLKEFKDVQEWRKEAKSVAQFVVDNNII